MQVKSINLIWIVVNDFKQAIQFYTEVVGLKIVEIHEEWGWAELEGHDGEGMRLGIGQKRLKNEDCIKPGENAVMTFTVDNIEKANQTLLKKGARLIGPIEEIPGHVKMQTVRDIDGNHFQIVEKIEAYNSCSTSGQMDSCCCH